MQFFILPPMFILYLNNYIFNKIWIHFRSYSWIFEKNRLNNENIRAIFFGILLILMNKSNSRLEIFFLIPRERNLQQFLMIDGQIFIRHFHCLTKNLCWSELFDRFLIHLWVNLFFTILLDVVIGAYKTRK